MKKYLKGMGLPAILFACGLLAMATGVVGAYAINNLQALTKEQTYDQAHYASYSGIQWALSVISQDPRVSSASATQYIGDLQFISNPELSCKVYIFSNLDAAANRCNKAPDGTIIPQNLIYVVADSQVAGSSGSTRSAQLSALCTPKQYYFNHALLGLAKVDVLGTSTIDAYTGGSTYATPASPVTAGEGSVATNDETGGVSVTIGAGSTVDGKAYVGKNGNPSTGIVVQPGATLTSNPGGQLNLPDNIAVKLDNLPGKSDFSYPGNLVVSGLQHLQGGATYQVNGDLVVGAGNQLVVDPNPASPPLGIPQENNAFVFVKGNVIVNGGILGDKLDKAEKLQIYLPKKGGGHTFTMDNGQGSFLICGPDLVADIKNNSDIQGSVIAKTIVLNNSKMHFDTKLRQNPKGPMGWAVGGFDSDNKKNLTGGNFPGPPVPAPVPPAPPGPVPPAPPYSPPTTTTPPYTSQTTQLP